MPQTEQVYTVYNNFPSLPDATKFWQYDKKIWKESLLQYRKLGYRTKIFCTHVEKFLLDAWDITPYYDEIDCDLLENNAILNQVDLRYFWSSRKMECIKFQLSINPYSIYSDTDVVMKNPFDLSSCDLLVWSSENDARFLSDIYRKWEDLTLPVGAALPDFIYNTTNSYNCGILWFNNPDWFNIFYVHYLNFVVGNPCKYLGSDPAVDENKIRVIYACNAEQRILRAVAEKYGLVVGAIEVGTQDGHAADGSIHYYNDKLNERARYEKKFEVHSIK